MQEPFSHQLLDLRIHITLQKQAIELEQNLHIKRIERLGVGLVIFFVIVSVLFVNWYTAVVSLGLVSLILGFALQTPISSFVAWIYILLRAPCRGGGRAEIGGGGGQGCGGG